MESAVSEPLLSINNNGVNNIKDFVSNGVNDNVSDTEEPQLNTNDHNVIININEVNDNEIIIVKPDDIKSQSSTEINCCQKIFSTREKNASDARTGWLDRNEASKSESEILQLYQSDASESFQFYGSLSDHLLENIQSHSVPTIICRNRHNLPQSQLTHVTASIKDPTNQSLLIQNYLLNNHLDPKDDDDACNTFVHRRTSLGATQSGRSPLISRQPPQTSLRRRLSCSTTKLSASNFTLTQKLTLLCLSMVSFTSFLSMSIIAPFFPNEASKKGMRESVSGFVFSVYALVIMLTSPVIGKMLPFFGAKFLLITGILFAGVCNILFGLLDQVDHDSLFVALCFLVRIFEALGAAAFSTASYTYIMQIFPDDIGTAFGLTETCVGLGMSLGPAVGGVLYSVGGYGLPFYALGTLMLINIPLCLILIKPIREAHYHRPSKSSYAKLLSIKEILVVCLVVVIVSQSVGFLDPTVEPHFRQFDLGAQYIGFIFLLLSAAYAITSPIIGCISTKLDNKFSIMAFGLFFITVGLLFLGPSNLIPLKPSLYLSIASMIIMGIAYAITFIPTFECILEIAINNGLEDDIATYSLVSGLWSSMYSLGEVTGPSLGGIFLEIFDFSISVTLMSGFSLSAAILVGITFYCKRNRIISQAESDLSDSGIDGIDYESASTKETSSASEPT